MKGRIFKLRLNAKNIDGDMDNFLFNKVQNRDNTHIYLSKGRVKNNDLDIDDYIFIQSEGKITASNEGSFDAFVEAYINQP